MTAPRKKPNHFIDINQVSADDLRAILDDAKVRKHGRHGRTGQADTDTDKPLKGRMLAMVFEKPSTRTRVSFEVAMAQLGGQAIVLRGDDMQLGRGETIADTAAVLSRYVDAIMIRTHDHSSIVELAEHATVPVINGLTDKSHPCQIVADIQTFEEHFDTIAGKRIAWIGDGNNVAVSWIHAAKLLDFTLALSCPDELNVPAELIDWAGDALELSDSPQAAATGAHCLVTDTFVSMGDKDAESRHRLLAPYQVTEALMALADPEAVFMHCLPAHRGDEVTAEVIDGPRSVVFDEAENRLHAQKAILAWCLS